MKIIDLTHELNNKISVYPGDEKPKIIKVANVEVDGFSTFELNINNHHGTHIESPAHMIKNGKSLKEYPLELFMGDAICLKIEDINSNLDLKGIKRILIYTGFDRYWGQDNYTKEYPTLNDEQIDILISLGIEMIGFDTLSPDKINENKNHLNLFNKDIIIIENLTNLNQVYGKNIELCALPFKIDGDAAPLRVIAKLD